MRWLGVVLFLVGCGDVKATSDAGGGGDGSGSGSIDASPDGPLVGEASISVQLRGTPTGGVKVNFHEADGSLVTEAVTDTNGKAKATVHVNATVTVAVGPNDLVTIAGVNPGEDIVLKSLAPDDNATAGTVAFATTAEAPNKSYYRVDVGGDQYSTYQTMTTGARTINILRRNLDGTGKFNIIAGTYSATNKLISYTFSTGITPSTSGTTNVTLPATWRTDILEFVTMLSGAPTGATQLDVFTYNELTGSQFMDSSFASTNTTNAAISGGNAGLYTQYPGGFGDFIQTQATVWFGTTSESINFWRRVARPAGAFNITANDFPARIGTPSLDKSMPTRPVASWTVTGSTVNGDATIVDLVWKDASNVVYRWHAYVPPDATSVTFPVVASSLSAQAPAQASIFTSMSVVQHCLEPLAGYGAFHLAPPIDYNGNYPMPAGFTTWSYATNSKSNP